MENKIDNKVHTAGIISLILGILALLLICVHAGLIFGILGLILGILSIKDNKNSSCGLEIAGITCSAIAIAISLLFMFSYTVDSANEPSDSEKLESGFVLPGNSITKNGIEMIYNKCEEYTDYKDYDKPHDGYKYVLFDFTINNNSERDCYITEFDFKCYADNVSCDMYYNTDMSISAELSKGRSSNGVVAFEVPIDAKDIELEYEENWFTESKIKFKYQ